MCSAVCRRLLRAFRSAPACASSSITPGSSPNAAWCTARSPSLSCSTDRNDAITASFGCISVLWNVRDTLLCISHISNLAQGKLLRLHLHDLQQQECHVVGTQNIPWFINSVTNNSEICKIFLSWSVHCSLQISEREPDHCANYVGGPKKTRFFHERLIYLKNYKKFISRLQSTLHWMICTYPFSVSTVRNISATPQLGWRPALLSKLR